MKEMYQEFFGGNERYTTETLLNKLTRLSHSDQNAFYERFIKGTEKLTLNPYLKHAGIQLEEVDGKPVFTISPDQTEQQRQIMLGMFGEN